MGMVGTIRGSPDSLLQLPLLARVGGMALAAWTHQGHHCAWQRGLETISCNIFDAAPCPGESSADLALKNSHPESVS